MKVRRAELFISCPQASALPESNLPEVAFLGRSNVGKSSLLNALVQRKQLARTSSTPGKTRMIHFFQVEIDATKLLLVDLPGYGFARVSKRERESWRRLVEGYLENRPQLRAAILLQDLRRDVSEDETLLLEWLAEREVPSLLVLTKIDKLKPMRRKDRIRVMLEGLGESSPPMLATSSQTKQGLPELWRAIRERL
ncbi:MAG: YihA family ribosome biogenesis GTP-binding protein [Deltaproteobacteria bacterium]|jgi:GTP-binding protein|nr:YihA family ribosome biogenesis GTP-binding protein [Deltaproteobacteria bacterium]MBW2382059.1 YihA family ribosome biogenesis GTP-binding protein [Deltaproteobacteria bacterium]MBW2696271.1 YihA family ribosome biogenesis GTP-binding protein [Deltaproteobacteria bacterium]